MISARARVGGPLPMLTASPGLWPADLEFLQLAAIQHHDQGRPEGRALHVYRPALRGAARARQVGHRTFILGAAFGEGDDEAVLACLQRHADMEEPHAFRRGQVGIVQERPEIIFPVTREILLHQNTTAGVEGHSLALPDRLALGRGITIGNGRRIAFADSQLTDAARHLEIALKQQRRHGKRVGDIVEAIRDGVARQIAGIWEINVQQIADSVAIFDAIETADDGLSHHRLLSRRRIQIGDQ